MKHVSLFLVLLCSLAACHYPKRTPVEEEDLSYYQFVIDSTAEVYTTVMEGNRRLVDLSPGSTVVVQGTPAIGDQVIVDYEGYQLVVHDPVWRKVSAVTYNRPSSFKSASGLRAYSYWVSSGSAVRTRPAVHALDLPANAEAAALARSGGSSYSGGAIHTGPRGGRYYINSKGNKTYVKSGSSAAKSSYKSSSKSSTSSSRSSGSRRR